MASKKSMTSSSSSSSSPLASASLHPTSYLSPIPVTLLPLLNSVYGSGKVSAAPCKAPPATFLARAFFSSSSSSAGVNAEHKEYKLPPPVNPPDAENPDAVTLRAQWNNAVRLYSRWYSHAWGTAILAGGAFFALGWWIKGENPLNPKKAKEVTE